MLVLCYTKQYIIGALFYISSFFVCVGESCSEAQWATLWIYNSDSNRNDAIKPPCTISQFTVYLCLPVLTLFRQIPVIWVIHCKSWFTWSRYLPCSFPTIEMHGKILKFDWIRRYQMRLEVQRPGTYPYTNHCIGQQYLPYEYIYNMIIEYVIT